MPPRRSVPLELRLQLGDDGRGGRALALAPGQPGAQLEHLRDKSATRSDLPGSWVDTSISGRALTWRGRAPQPRAFAVDRQPCRCMVKAMGTASWLPAMPTGRRRSLQG